MDSSQLQQLAQQTRSRRETGLALLISSGLLALFLFIPLAGSTREATPKNPPENASAALVFPAVSIEAKAAIVYDLVTGETLYEKNADAQLPLASLTKLLTVYAGVSALPLETPIMVSRDALQVEFPRAFNEGQSFRLGDIARLTLTASLNDGAAAIAETVAARQNRTEGEMLASAAAALDLSQTFAINGNGLDINAAISGGYGSARDVARLAGALVEKAPSVAAATAENYAEATSLGGTHYRVKNTDPIVDSIPQLLLSKTGFTDLAGGNLALVFDSSMGHPIAIVVLGSTQKSRFADGTALVHATFAHFANSSSL